MSRLPRFADIANTCYNTCGITLNLAATQPGCVVSPYGRDAAALKARLDASGSRNSLAVATANIVVSISAVAQYEHLGMYTRDGSLGPELATCAGLRAANTKPLRKHVMGHPRTPLSVRSEVITSIEYASAVPS